MTKKILFMSMMCLPTLTGMAQENSLYTDSLATETIASEVPFMKPQTPTYLKNVYKASGWDSNWFVEMKGGASAFLGTPIGCGDVFDRTSPIFQIGIGKWFTPAVGGRVGYQGLHFKNAKLTKMEYHFVHADFMYNLIPFFGQNEVGLSRWDIIPFVGVGMIYNADWPSCCACVNRTSGSHPFAFSYGIEARYRLNNRMHLVAEISGMTTSRKFDGIGSSTRFGDNMVNLSAGLSFTLGKVGYKRVVDAKPYISQNDFLVNHVSRLERSNNELRKQDKKSKQVIAEYRKILEIEGLLDKYADNLNQENHKGTKSLFPRNDYSGLNSLRTRLGNQGWDGKPDTMPKAMKKRSEGYDKEPIVAPIFFFFQLATTNFTEESQILNVDEIAKVAKLHGLKVKITGAADSSTGNDTINETLSRQRAEYIKSLMLERGVSEDNIITEHEGGIDAYSPIEANRNTCVILSYQ